MNNLYAVILAGGIGARMGNLDKPKQFLNIGSRPVIVHTIEKFLINNEFERIIVTCPADWIIYLNDLLKKYLNDLNRIDVVPGGENRNGSIINAIAHIKEEYVLDDNTMVVTHDGVRPFVTQRIIRDNIECIKKGIACDTVVKTTDTVVESVNGKHIRYIPNRSYLYNGQTPQSFMAVKFLELYNSFTEEEKLDLTDAAKVFVVKEEKVAMIEGEKYNLKITSQFDLILAEILIKDY